ncbi:MAG: hypothetical protein WCX82_01920 [archaeon]|jgi:hypothetical protein
MAKENNTKLIIWAVVALVIGVVIGLLITNIVTTGNAKFSLQQKEVIDQALDKLQEGGELITAADGLCCARGAKASSVGYTYNTDGASITIVLTPVCNGSACVSVK